MSTQISRVQAALPPPVLCLFPEGGGHPPPPLPSVQEKRLPTCWWEWAPVIELVHVRVQSCGAPSPGASQQLSAGSAVPHRIDKDTEAEG